MVALPSQSGGLKEHQKGTRCDSSTVPAAVSPLDSMHKAQCTMHKYHRESCIVNCELIESLIATSHWSSNDWEGAIEPDKSEDLPFTPLKLDVPAGYGHQFPVFAIMKAGISPS